VARFVGLLAAILDGKITWFFQGKRVTFWQVLQSFCRLVLIFQIKTISATLRSGMFFILKTFLIQKEAFAKPKN
jgi:hypothetical protein